MRDLYSTRLVSLIDSLAAMTRAAGAQMRRSTEALQTVNLHIAEQAILADDDLNATADDLRSECYSLLALQAPVATDLRLVLAALQAVEDLERMGDLAQHIAKIVRLKHPQPVLRQDVRAVVARMGLLAATLADSTAEIIEQRDPLGVHRLDAVDDEVDALHGSMFRILFSPDWTAGAEPAVDAALIGRYYERFCDHAVSVAQKVTFLVTGNTVPANYH